MPRGISLHVGINQYSSAFPGAATLIGCENDAREMEKIAVAKGFERHDLLLGADATYARVTTKIRSAAAQLEKDDIFLFTFAGHGFQRVDSFSDGDEEDGLDETILLFDVELVDDVFKKDLWPCFKAGVRVLMIADSCHSGTVSELELSATDNTDEHRVSTPDGLVARTISPETARRHLNEYAEFYRNILGPLFKPIDASILLLAACEEFDTTGDGPNGVYTGAMLKVLKNSDPTDYDELVERIGTELAPQNPVIHPVGQADPEFREQKPFTI